MKKIAPWILTAIWIIILSIAMGSLPPMGNFLSPGIGFWADAKPVDSAQTDFRPYRPDSVLKRVTVIFDHRLVPHILAKNDYDLYYTQGYIQAYYRLWQMDMQTRAAAGRLSEIVGKKALVYDRGQRRKGMIWAAKRSLKLINENPKSRMMLQAFSDGVNAYIHSLPKKDLPLGYKLLNFQPKDWTPLKCALMMKYMADMLTGESSDIALTYARQALGDEEIRFLFPDKLKKSDPVIPQGTSFTKPSLQPAKRPYGKVWAQLPMNKDTSKSAVGTVFKRPLDIGSNNWALSGEKTKSGDAILCNDPHLNLNLPSIWFESQLTSPGQNCYGVSVVGAPGIVIGFNDSISWGLTNNYRDVKDYYALKTDSAEQYYYFDGQKKVFRKQMDTIKIRGEQPFIDTVRYSIQGPVEYDPSFPGPAESKAVLAMQWIGHRATNEVLSVYLLDRAKNYSEFVTAIQHFQCPAQNFIYADTRGNIALWGQGRFVNNWPDQGKFVMRGDTSATLWGQNIPMSENPHVLNPPQHYLESANQQVTDSTYPYYYGGDFTEFRSWEITHFLNRQKKFGVQDMMALQNNNWSIIASKVMPLFYRYGAHFHNEFPEYSRSWNDTLDVEGKTGSAFQIWWHFLYHNIWHHQFDQLPIVIYPTQERTLDLILTDTTALATFADTPFVAIVHKSFRQTGDSLKRLKKHHKTVWYQIKNTSVIHLTRLPALSFSELKTGGSRTTINAMSYNHGPSWRMIVQMKQGDVSAWCSYPGGQSGNPGSPYYASFLEHWVKGKYYKIHFFHRSDFQRHLGGNGRK